jgi:hypothetical protein
MEHEMAGATDHIGAAIKSQPLCEQIVQFLVEHEYAMDTIRGIAKCWVNQDEIAVQSALDSLVAIGLLISQSFSSGTYYSLTSDARLRAWLTARQQSLEFSRPVLSGEGEAAMRPSEREHRGFGTDQSPVETGASQDA